MTKLKKTAKQLAKKGRFGDDKILHVSQAEIDGIAQLVPGGKLPINPETGMPEAFLFALLAPLLGAAGAAAAPAAAAAGTGLAGLGAGLGAAAAPAVGAGLAAGTGATAAGALGATGAAALPAATVGAGLSSALPTAATAAQTAMTAAPTLAAGATPALAEGIGAGMTAAQGAGLGAGSGATAFTPATVATLGADKAVPALTQAATYVEPTKLAAMAPKGPAPFPVGGAAVKGPAPFPVGPNAPVPQPSPGAPNVPVPTPSPGAPPYAVDIHALPASSPSNPVTSPPGGVTPGKGVTPGGSGAWDGARNVTAGADAVQAANPAPGGFFGNMDAGKMLQYAALGSMLLPMGGGGGGGEDEDEGPSEKKVSKMGGGKRKASFPDDDYEAGIDNEWKYFSKGGPVQPPEEQGGLGGLMNVDPYVGPGGGNPEYGTAAPNLTTVKHMLQNPRLDGLAAAAGAKPVAVPPSMAMTAPAPQVGIAPQPMMMAKGGPIDDGLAGLQQDALGDDELISAVAEAIMSPAPGSQALIQMFVDRYGQEALQDLITRVEQMAGGKMSQAPTTDIVDAKLTPGEFVVNREAVGNIGDGDIQKGQAKLGAMMEKAEQGKKVKL